MMMMTHAVLLYQQKSDDDEDDNNDTVVIVDTAIKVTDVSNDFVMTNESAIVEFRTGW